MSNYMIIFVILIIIAVAVGVGIALAYEHDKDKATRWTRHIESSKFDVYLHENDLGPYENDIRTALNRWEDYINDATICRLDFYSYYEPNSTTLAYATNVDPNNLKSGGDIYINTGRNAPVAGWDDVIEHEIGHILGLPGNQKWQRALVMNTQNGKYALDGNIFSETLAEAQTIDASIIRYIPLSVGGSHWDESTFGIETMTPLIENEPDLKTTRLTLTALKELGWDINFTNAETL